MIVYSGIKTINKIPFVCFTKSGKSIQIPIDKITAERFSRYLEKLGVPFVGGNVESEEEVEDNSDE